MRLDGRIAGLLRIRKNLIPSTGRVTKMKFFACHYKVSLDHQGLHLTAKIPDRGYGLVSLRLKPRFETELELYFILRSPKPHGLVWSSDRFNRGLV